MELSNVFKLLKNECSFVDEILKIGVTELYKADFTRSGIYYQCFTCLSTGLERLMKIIISMEKYYNDNEFYNTKELKKIGHNLNELYKHCKEISFKYSIDNKYSENDKLYENIMEILSKFADIKENNRYYNLNYLSNANEPNFKFPDDAMSDWHNIIDDYIYKNLITKKKKSKNELISTNVGEVLNNCSLSKFDLENKTEINNSKDAIGEWSKIDLCRNYRVLFISQIIRYLSKILNNYNELLIGNENIPYFYEFLQPFRLTDKALLSKKQFVK